jgi:hypothetical protein
MIAQGNEVRETGSRNPEVNIILMNSLIKSTEALNSVL